MSNPFLIDGPALISFSGGRTSGYMLYHVLEAGLQDDVWVVFANTGKERPETLDFVNECELQFGTPIMWVEYYRTVLPNYRSVERKAATARTRQHSVLHPYTEYSKTLKEDGFRVVTYETASRAGEPFENLIECTGLPNPVTRLCTQELKIRPMKRFMQGLGYQHWDNIVGIRADEPKRVARMRVPNREPWENILPLADAGTTKADVLAFWAKQSFDLQLALDEDGETYEGNCDMCFLKSTKKRARIAQEHPERLVWWVAQEARSGSTFLPHGKSFADLPYATPAECAVDDDLGDCVCHD